MSWKLGKLRSLSRPEDKIEVEALDLYDVPPLRRATAIGFALYRAIEAGKANLDPMVEAQIVLQCATRTSKIYLG